MNVRRFDGRLARDTDRPKSSGYMSTTIRTSGEALLVIINDILDYSKNRRSGKLVLHPEPFDLRAW